MCNSHIVGLESMERYKYFEQRSIWEKVISGYQILCRIKTELLLSKMHLGIVLKNREQNFIIKLIYCNEMKLYSKGLKITYC